MNLSLDKTKITGIIILLALISCGVLYELGSKAKAPTLTEVEKQAILDDISERRCGPISLVNALNRYAVEKLEKTGLDQSASVDPYKENTYDVFIFYKKSESERVTFFFRYDTTTKKLTAENADTRAVMGNC